MRGGGGVCGEGGVRRRGGRRVRSHEMTGKGRLFVVEFRETSFCWWAWGVIPPGSD